MLTNFEIIRWFESKGFEKGSAINDCMTYRKENKVRVIFKKKVLRVEINYPKDGWVRVGGDYYGTLYFDDTGLLRCCGFLFYKELNKYINKKVA